MTKSLADCIKEHFLSGAQPTRTKDIAEKFGASAAYVSGIKGSLGLINRQSYSTNEVEQMLTDFPDMKLKDIADVVGCSKAYVSIVRKNMRLGSSTERISELRKRAAMARRISPNELDKQILLAVYGDDIINAVLDDNKP